MDKRFEFTHKPVLLNECMELLAVKPDGIYIDATLGLGGHSEAILERLETGRLLGIDRDPNALGAASERLLRFGNRFSCVKANFQDMADAAKTAGVSKADGILFDLGVSSYQLDDPARGFSYTADAPLDMRMDPSSGPTAADIVNGYDESGLERVLRDYGEERFARRVASAIAGARSVKSIKTTRELADIIVSAIPAGAARREKHTRRRGASRV